MPDLTTETLAVDTYRATEMRRAQLYVCSRGFDVDDARLLFDILGLNGRPINGGGWQYRKGQKKARCVRCHKPRSIKGMGMCGTCWAAVKDG